MELFNTYVISLFILLVFREVSCTNTRKIKCDKMTENLMDSSAAKLLVVGQKNVKFPVNAQQLRIYCNEAKKLLDYIGAYSNRCMPRFGRETARLLLLSMNKEIKIVCKSGKLSGKAKELLRASPCANAGLEAFQKCNTALIEAYMGILNADVMMRIPMGCCNFHKMRECLITEAEGVKECTESTVEFIDRHIANLLENVLQFLCLQYDESNEKCEQLVKNTPKRNSSQPLPKSILPPFIAIGTSIGDIPGPF